MSDDALLRGLVLDLQQMIVCGGEDEIVWLERRIVPRPAGAGRERDAGYRPMPRRSPVIKAA